MLKFIAQLTYIVNEFHVLFGRIPFLVQILDIEREENQIFQYGPHDFYSLTCETRIT